MRQKQRMEKRFYGILLVLKKRAAEMFGFYAKNVDEQTARNHE